MKHLLLCTMIAGVAGCSTDQVKPFLDNLSHDCTRDYSGTFGGGIGGGATVAFHISCNPENPAPKPAPTTP